MTVRGDLSKSVERLIGWLTFAIGASTIQRNDSIAYRVMDALAPMPLWIIAFCGIGLVLVVLSYTTHERARLLVIFVMLMLWLGMLTFVALTGPLGPIGSYGAVISCYLFWLIVRHIKDGP